MLDQRSLFADKNTAFTSIMTIRQKESFRELSIFNVLPCFYRNKLEQIRIIITLNSKLSARLCRFRNEMEKELSTIKLTLNYEL